MSTLRHSRNATIDTDCRRIPFSLHFGQLRASNYQGNSRGFQRVRVVILAYMRNTFQILPPRAFHSPFHSLSSHSADRKRCHTSLPVSLWFADSRILSGEREFRPYSIALRISGIPIPPYFYMALIGGHSIHKFSRGIWENPLDAYTGTWSKDYSYGKITRQERERDKIEIRSLDITWLKLPSIIVRYFHLISPLLILISW